MIVGYVDESGFENMPDTRSGWHQAGREHRHCAAAERGTRVNVMGTLLSTGELLLKAVTTPVDRELFFGYLLSVAAQLHEKYPEKAKVMILDNASIHKQPKADRQYWVTLLKERYNLTLYYLPPYSPELNRIELIWHKMKYAWRPFVTMATEELINWVHQAGARFTCHADSN